MQAPELGNPPAQTQEGGTPPAAEQNGASPSGQAHDAAASAGQAQGAEGVAGSVPGSATDASPGQTSGVVLPAGQPPETVSSTAPAPDIPAVQSAGPDFFSVDVLLPAFLAVITLAIYIAGLRQSRLLSRRSVLLFLALNGFTLTACLAADFHLAAKVPEWALQLSPLALSLVYLFVGGIGKKPLIWGAGLATPGLWFFAQRLDGVYFHLSRYTLALPQDPAWFLLIGAVLFVLMHIARIQKFWDAMEQPELTASFCYLMAGLWLLSLGGSSVLALFALPVYAWMAILVVLAGVGFWVSRLLGDIALAICCGFGVIGALYSFGMYVFAPAGV